MMFLGRPAAAHTTKPPAILEATRDDRRGKDTAHDPIVVVASNPKHSVIYLRVKGERP